MVWLRDQVIVFCPPDKVDAMLLAAGIACPCGRAARCTWSDGGQKYACDDHCAHEDGCSPTTREIER